MPRVLQVVTPMEHLYVRDGVEVALITAEIWSRGVIVRLAGLPSEETDRLEKSHADALNEWGRARRDGRPHDERPPEQPGEQLFDVEITVSDDLGTSYELRVRSSGGSGRLMRADWTFEPDRPTRLPVSLWQSTVKESTASPCASSSSLGSSFPAADRTGAAVWLHSGTLRIASDLRRL